MNNQRARKNHAMAPQPIRLRDRLAVFAIALGLIALLFHSHPVSGFHPAAGNHAVLTDASQNPDACALCAAIHSANPEQSAAIFYTSLLATTVLLPADQEIPVSPVAYTQFSRPPPTSPR